MAESSIDKITLHTMIVFFLIPLPDVSLICTKNVNWYVEEQRNLLHIIKADIDNRCQNHSFDEVDRLM